MCFWKLSLKEDSLNQLCSPSEKAHKEKSCDNSGMDGKSNVIRKTNLVSTAPANRSHWLEEFGIGNWDFWISPPTSQVYWVVTSGILEGVTQQAMLYVKWEDKGYGSNIKGTFSWDHQSIILRHYKGEKHRFIAISSIFSIFIFSLLQTFIL